MMHLSNIQLSVRAAAAAVISLEAAQLLQLQYPGYAFVAAVVVTDLKTATSRRLGLLRIVATALGAICGALLSLVLAPGPWTVGAGVLIAMLVTQFLNAGDVARVAGFICGIVLLEHSTDPWFHAFHRFVETAIGVLVAWSISYIPKLFDAEKHSDTSP